MGSSASRVDEGKEAGQPGMFMRVLLISANREKLPSPVVPLGVLQIAGAARAAGHDVRVLDLCFVEDVDRAIEDASSFSPDVVGIGLRNLHTNAYDGTERLVAEYATIVATVRRCARAVIVLGGAGFSLQPTHLLDRLGGDHGIAGEGELSFVSLLTSLAAGQAVPRLLDASAMRTFSAPVPLRMGAASRATLADLDALPRAARDLVAPEYYEFDGTDNVQTKRGCAFACTYCDYPDLEGRKVRVRDPELVADEVAERARIPGVTHAFFVDSVFNVPPAHALAVCNALIARGAPLPWVCYGSPVAFDETLVRAMVRAGCQGVEVGSDAGSDRMLKRLKKPFRRADILRTRELFVEHGLLDCHTFVLGAEGETAEEARETLELVDAFDPDIAVFIVFMEDRESMTVHRAEHREALLALLAREAPRRSGWVVPELGIRFGAKVTRVVQRQKLRGPSWLHLARQRRAALAPAAE
jgi:radical SAM superfamily enzyme YgiQ (UPF0313 family)